MRFKVSLASNKKTGEPVAARLFEFVQKIETLFLFRLVLFGLVGGVEGVLESDKVFAWL